MLSEREVFAAAWLMSAKPKAAADLVARGGR